MTDRVNHLVVTLAADIRTDDAAALVSAIALLSGVERVEMGDAVSVSTKVVAEGRVRREVGERVMALGRRIALDERD